MNKIIQKEQEKVVNGVNVTKLSGIVSAIQESPKIENEDKDHSKDNINDLSCINETQNLNDVQQIFGDGSDEVAQE